MKVVGSHVDDITVTKGRRGIAATGKRSSRKLGKKAVLTCLLTMDMKL